MLGGIVKLLQARVTALGLFPCGSTRCAGGWFGSSTPRASPKKPFCVFPLTRDLWHTGHTGSSAPSKDNSSPIGLPSSRDGHLRAGCANPAVNPLLPALLVLIKPNEVSLAISGAPTEPGWDPGATWLAGNRFQSCSRSNPSPSSAPIQIYAKSPMH